MDTENRLPTRFLHRVFADEIEITLFLGALLFFAIFWRIDIFISDNYTLANTLANLAAGQLHVTTVPIGPQTANTPGMHQVGYRLYGRNYGQLFLSLPAFWLLQAADVISEPDVFLAGIWSILLIVFSKHVGIILGQEREFVVLGSLGSLAIFAGNLWFAHTIAPTDFPIAALQITSMIAAALVGVFLYRTVRILRETRTALFTGVVAVLATPIGFWATIPKRHVFTALFVVLALYAFVGSREAETALRTRHYRIGMYAAVGMTAWIHAAEGLVLLLVVGSIDFLTTEQRSARSVGVIVVAFLVSLIPFFLTNYAISGDLLRPPRMLPDYSPTGDGLSPPITEGNASGASPSDSIRERLRTEGKPPTTIHEPESAIWVRILDRMDRLLGFVSQGVTVLLTNVDAVVDTYLFRTGTTFARGESEFNLALLETTPVLGALAAGVFVLRRRVAGKLTSLGIDRSNTNALAVGFASTYAVVHSLLYLPRLPIHASVTVRYLVPIVPMLLVLIAHLPAITRMLDRHWTTFAATVAAVVLIGSQLLIVGLSVMGLTTGEGMQLFGLLAVAAALIAAVTVSYDTVRPSSATRETAIGLGLAVGMGAVFVVMTGVVFFPYGEYVLGGVGTVSDLIAAGL